MIARCIDRTYGQRFAFYHGDNVEVMPGIADNSIHLTLSSWPFGDQYGYSDAPADFGNCDDNSVFFRHMDFLIPELLRATIPGRIAAVHCKDRTVYGTKNGGRRKVDRFSDKCADAMEAHGWDFEGRITVVTDPVRENAQTNNLGHGELQKDGSRLFVGMPEYVLLFRKPHTLTAQGGQWSDVRIDSLTPANGYSLPRWQIDANSFWRSSGKRVLLPWEANGYDYAAHVAHLERLDELHQLGRANGEPIPVDSPWVMWDVQRTKTLNTRMVKRDPDEKHICPLQTDLTERIITRFSNPGELVLDYFAGIGTVPYVALERGRRGVGIELKPNYYEVGRGFLEELEYQQAQPTMFDMDALEVA